MTDDRSSTVLIDLDGVLADFDGSVVRALEGTCPDLCNAATRSEYRLITAFPQYEAEIRKETSRWIFFWTLPLMPDAREGWKNIRRAGFTPRVCSSPLRSNRMCRVAKRLWVLRHFGFKAGRRAIITSDKAAQRGIALIDDRTDIKGADQAPWQLILFDSSYNDLPGAPRLHGWRDPALADLLADARARYKSRFSE